MTDHTDTDHTEIDLDCLRRTVLGDLEAIGGLAERYEASMLGLARGLLHGDQDLACDAVQETWVRVIQHAGGFRGDSGVKTWMYRILVNHCHTMRRQTRKEVRTGDAVAVADAGQCEPSAPEVIEEDDLLRVRVAVDALDRPKRDTVLLCCHTGMTQEQAAEILDVPLGTLKSRMRSALKELRGRLAPEEVAS